MSAARTQQLGQEADDGGSDGDDGNDNKDGNPSPPPQGGKRSGRSATMGSEEWSRQRKDNHVRLNLILFFLLHVADRVSPIIERS